MPDFSIRKWSREDIFIYLLFSPAMALYILADRFPLVYATPFLYALPFLKNKLKEFVAGNLRLRPIRQQLTELAFPAYMLMQTLLILIWHEKVFLLKPLVRDLVIHSGFFLMVLVPGKFHFQHIRFLFLVLLFSYVAWIDYSNPYALISSLFSSRPPTEFDMGLFFGLFPLYFLHRNKTGWLLLSLLVLIFVSKRVLYLGIFLSALWYFSARFIRPLQESGLRFSLFFPAFLMATAFCFFLIPFFQLIFGNDAGATASLDSFLTGRLNAILFEMNAISESGFWQKIIGHGAGQLDVQVSLHQPVPWANAFPEPTNPHNDYLKILYDFGIAGSLTFAMSIASRFGKTAFGFMLMIFTWTLFFFENALIHLYFNMISAILLQVSENENKIENQKE